MKPVDRTLARQARLHVAIEEILRLRYGADHFRWWERIQGGYLTVGVVPQGVEHGHYVAFRIEGDAERCRELILESLLRSLASEQFSHSARAVEAGCG